MKSAWRCYEICYSSYNDVDMTKIIREIKAWLFKDEKGKVVIAQLPNWQLAGAAVAWVIQFIAKEGSIYKISRSVFIILIIFWSYEEIVHGVNGFRRILGTAVLAMTFVGIYSMF